MNKNLYPLYVLRHPAQGYEDLKVKRLFSFPAACAVIVCFLLVDTFQYFKTGFGYNQNNLHDYNVIFSLLRTVFVFLLWCLSNWLLCTLMEGKGNFKEIFAASAYALVPYTIITFLVTVITNAVLESEMVFINWVQMFGIAWSGILLLIAMKQVHEYTVGKTVLSMLLTAVGIAIILFLLVLSFSVYQQVFDTFRTIFNEIMYRL